MNFAPFNVLEFDGAFPSLVNIASWLPTFVQPGRLAIYAAGTTFGMFPTVGTMVSTKALPDPWRSTSSRTGPDPTRGTAIRDPPNIVSSPPRFMYRAPPAPPSNAGFQVLSVPDPRRGTSTPLYGPFKPFVIPEFLSWQPTYVEPSRPILRAPGTDHVKDVWRFPEAVSADKWQITVIQPSRAVVRDPGTTYVKSPAEVIFADKWQSTTVQPIRQVIYAKGTDSVLVREVVTADKWLPTTVQPSRKLVKAEGTSFVGPVWTLDTVADLAVCQGRLTLVSGQPLGNGSGTTLYFTPFKGNLIGFQQGQVLPFSETSISIPAPTGVYDVFAYNNSGTLALEFSSAWSTTGDGTGADGTRANAISLTNGIYYKSSDTTRRYLGTIYSVGGTSYDVSGGVGTQGRRFVWNYHNRARKIVVSIESTPFWDYATAVVRPLNNDTSVTGTSSIRVVCGVSEDTIESAIAMNFQGPNPPGLGRYSPSIGYDQNSAASSGNTWIGIPFIVSSSSGGIVTTTAATVSLVMYEYYSIQENIGLHTFWGLEFPPDGISYRVFANGQGTDVHAFHWC